MESISAPKDCSLKISNTRTDGCHQTREERFNATLFWVHTSFTLAGRVRNYTGMSPGGRVMDAR